MGNSKKMILQAIGLLLAATIPVWGAALKVVPGAYSSGKAYVTCTIDGVMERCFLDTGSAMTMVSATGRFAGYTNVGGIAVKSASGIAQETETIQVGSVRIDDMVFSNVRMGRANFRGAESTLGIDIVGRQPFGLRFGNKAGLVLNAPRPQAPLTTLHVSSHGVISIPMTVAGRETVALWDTGASFTTVDAKFVSANPENFRATKVYARGLEGTGRQLLLQSFRAKKLTVGDRTFEDVRVVAADLSVLREHVSPDIQVVLGFNVISKGNWFFDTKNKLWKFER